MSSGRSLTCGWMGLLLAGCSKPPCPNEVLVGAPSPDGANIAFVYRRQCGGPTGSSTHVSVIDIRHPLRSGAGNVLVVDGLQPVKAVWHGPTTLVVSGFHDPAVENAQVGGVTIEFPVPPGGR